MNISTLERQIESDLEDATDQLSKSANSSDMLFVLIDNPDTRFMMDILFKICK